MKPCTQHLTASRPSGRHGGLRVTGASCPSSRLVKPKDDLQIFRASNVVAAQTDERPLCAHLNGG